MKRVVQDTTYRRQALSTPRYDSVTVTRAGSECRFVEAVWAEVFFVASVSSTFGRALRCFLASEHPRVSRAVHRNDLVGRAGGGGAGVFAVSLWHVQQRGWCRQLREL